MTPPDDLRAQRLAKLRQLQELRRQRDAMVAHDPNGARRTLITALPTALDFAQRFDMRTKRTPALELIARKMRETLSSYDGRLVISMPPQEGKLLESSTPVWGCRMDDMATHADTPVLSPAGFIAMEDIAIGDYVFHPSGKPVQVIAKTARQDDRPLYRVTTSDGRSVVADEQHVWTVQDRRRQKSRGPKGARERYMEWENLTTTELLERGLLREKPRQRPNGSWIKANALRIPRQEVVQTADVELPIEPYLFGLWLADGSAVSAMFTEGLQDAEELAANVEAAGGATITRTDHRVTAQGWQGITLGFRLIGASEERLRNEVGNRFVSDPDGFHEKARQLGVLGNKHIPDLYLTAGTDQRLALLQGLLDGDGSISSNGRTSRVEYTTVIPELAEQVLLLVRSLGWRATVKDSKAALNGVEKQRRYRVTFTPVQGELPPFRLKRKAERVQVDQSRGDERHVVTIDSIERVENGSGYCIQVDSPDGLFLAGRDLIATHNSTLLQWMIVWALCDNPDRRIVNVSFAQSLARRTGRDVRNMLRSHSELGLPLDRSHQDATDWGIESRKGGLYSVGVGGALTGRPSDLMVLDDPLKGREQADSDTVRESLHEWWASVARTRLAPGAPALIIATRWHEDDLSGRMIEQGWPLVNIPALADGETEDALERPAGEWMISARGRSREDWEQVRRDVGEREFAAMYQGRPAPLEGGIFQHAWFDAHRIPEDKRPAFQMSVVGVDPADTGKGDAAGILVAGVTRDGTIVFTDDLSAQLSQAQWARKACIAWVTHGAARIVQEHNLGMRTSIPDAWALLYRQAQALADVPDDQLTNGDDSRPPFAHDELAARGDTQAADLRQLWTILPVFRQIVDAGSGGPRVVSITPKQSKRVRAESVAGAFETGRARMLGQRLLQLEYEACFPAGTPVLTEMGQKPIEQVTTRDRVLTRNGWRAVQWSGQTGVHELLEVRTADGHVLRATPNHRVWVEGHGWKQLRFVTSGHRMRTCPGLALASTSTLMGTLTRLTPETATGKPTSVGTSGSSNACSTGTSGAPPTARSPRGGMSITWITTSPTTTSATSRRCPPALMQLFTPPNGVGRRGTAKPAVLSAVGTGLSANRLPECASTATVGSSRPASEPSTATPTAVRPITTRSGALRNELGTTPLPDEPSTIVLSVEPVNGPKVPVYDLTVADDHEFFAGGLLVHNCTWQEGQRSPNRLDTMAMLATHLEGVRGQVRISRPTAGPSAPSEGGAAVIPLNTARRERDPASDLVRRRGLRMAPLPPNDPRGEIS